MFSGSRMDDFPLAPVVGGPAPKKRRRHTRNAVRVFFCVFFAFAALVSLAALRLSRGLPRELADRLGTALSSETVAVEPADISFSLFTMSLRIGEIKAFRRFKVAGPIVAAKGVSVRFLPKTGASPSEWVSSLKIDSLRVDADLSSDGDERGGPLDALEGVVLPDFPPVSVSCGRADVLGFAAKNVSFSLSASSNALSACDCVADFYDGRLPPQRLEGAVRVIFGVPALEAQAQGRFDPNLCAPVLCLAGEEDVAEEISRFKFAKEAPALVATYRYCPSNGERDLKLSITAGESSYNGVALEGFSGDIFVGCPSFWGRLRVPNVVVRRPEGVAAGAIELVPRIDRFDFSGESTLDPVALLTMLEIIDEGDWFPAVFSTNTQLSARGTLALGALATNEIRAELAAPLFSVQGIAFSNAVSSMRLSGDELEIPDFTAQVFDGGFSARAVMRLPAAEDSPTNRPVDFSARLDNASYAAVSCFRNPGSEPEGGLVSTSISLVGPFDDIVEKRFKETVGSVSLDIKDTRIYRIPVFAGLTDLLANSIPGIDWLVDADKLSMRGSIGGGRLRVEKLAIDGTVASLSGKGSIYFPERDIDLKFKGHLLNRSTWLGEGIYWMLSPISKMLEIRATGAADSPRWSSATFQSNPSRRK
ncbi:MAG: hypothetical protein IJS46_01295 [Kiritimatiellae bacterium]|nr:hypothetical protein [Kiritimatiellia bacterium]